MKKPKKIVNEEMKYCNNCGNYAKVYQVRDNAPLCENCFPNLEKELKKIPSESTMVQRVLDVGKK